MPDDELALPRLDVPELPDEPATYAIRRVREVLAPTQLIAPPPPTQPREIPEKANIAWQLHVWSGPRKRPARPLGMADMGGTQQARPRDGARAKNETR